jgi:hypothetical protein
MTKTRLFVFTFFSVFFPIVSYAGIPGDSGFLNQQYILISVPCSIIILIMIYLVFRTERNKRRNSEFNLKNRGPVRRNSWVIKNEKISQKTK